jgi:hypothetical protein
MANYWAYTNALLGQVDTSIVADIPVYGEFRETGTLGNRLVAYHPTWLKREECPSRCERILGDLSA